jgi:hypothetical protein
MAIRDDAGAAASSAKLDPRQRGHAASGKRWTLTKSTRQRIHHRRRGQQGDVFFTGKAAGQQRQRNSTDEYRARPSLPHERQHEASADSRSLR